LLLEQKLERCCEFASAKDAAIFLLWQKLERYYNRDLAWLKLLVLSN
jgi:hypothetical protein